ncbi:hypothetical protein ACS0TY_000763 [Phlomoides rotata]
MKFDLASENPWETDYQAIVGKHSAATPVPGSQNGVALVSGYSNLMTLFLEKCGTLDPVTVMENVICGEEYQKLVVVD